MSQRQNALHRHVTALICAAFQTVPEIGAHPSGVEEMFGFEPQQ
jgi:hypothetical protein